MGTSSEKSLVLWWWPHAESWKKKLKEKTNHHKPLAESLHKGQNEMNRCSRKPSLDTVKGRQSFWFTWFPCFWHRCIEIVHTAGHEYQSTLDCSLFSEYIPSFSTPEPLLAFFCWTASQLSPCLLKSYLWVKIQMLSFMRPLSSLWATSSTKASLKWPLFCL